MRQNPPSPQVLPPPKQNDAVRTTPTPHPPRSPFIHHRNRMLRAHAQLPLLQFTKQDRLINGFQQPWTEPPVYAVRRVDDLPSHIIFGHTETTERLAVSSLLLRA